MYHRTLPAPAGRRLMLAIAGLLLFVALAATSLAQPGTAAADTVPTKGYWQLRPAHTQNMCLDVANFSVAHAADVIQGRCSGGRNQQWRFEATTNGYYEVIARHSGKCLDVANRSTAHGANVIQGKCWSPGFNQRWFLVPEGM